jgi:hypothetical protein
MCARPGSTVRFGGIWSVLEKNEKKIGTTDNAAAKRDRRCCQFFPASLISVFKTEGRWCRSQLLNKYIQRSKGKKSFFFFNPVLPSTSDIFDAIV